MDQSNGPVIILPDQVPHESPFQWVQNHPFITGFIICVVIVVISSIMATIIVSFQTQSLATQPLATQSLAPQPLTTPPLSPNELLNPLPTKVISQVNPVAVKTITPPSTPRAITAADSAYNSLETAKAQSNIVLQGAKDAPSRPVSATSTASSTAPQTVTGLFSGKFNAYNFLTIYQNGDVAYSATGIKYKQQQNVNFTVTSGDVLIFMVQNNSVAPEGTSYGGLIGEFTWNGVTYYTDTSLFSSTQYVKTKGNALSNATEGTISTSADWKPPIDSKTITAPASTWTAVKSSTLYPNSKWVWEKDNCSECYVRFVWTVPGNLSPAAQEVLNKQIEDPLFKVYPGGMAFNGYFIASNFLSIYINNDLVYFDPSLTSKQIQNINLTVYVNDTIDFVVQNTQGYENSLNGNFTIGPTSYYTGMANSPIVNCYTVEYMPASATRGTLPASYPIPGLTQDTCVIGPHLNIMPGSDPISPSRQISSGYAVYRMTLSSGSSGFIGTVNQFVPSLVSKFNELKNQVYNQKKTQAFCGNYSGFTASPVAYFRSNCAIKY